MPATPIARIKGKHNPFQNNSAFTATLVAGVEAANAVPITGQVRDNRGRVMEKITVFDAWFASSATTFLVHGAGPNTSITASVGSIIPGVGNRIFQLITNATGAFTLSAADSGAFTGFLCVRMPDGTVAVSNVVTLV